MLSQYKNINTILSSTKPVSGVRLSPIEIDLLQYIVSERVKWNNDIASGRKENQSIAEPRISEDFIEISGELRPSKLNKSGTEVLTELHIYSADSWITGNHRVSISRAKKTSLIDPVTNQKYSLQAQPIEIDLYQQFSDLKLTRGNYRFVLNFFDNLIGSYDKPALKIDEISPDRTEVRLRLIDSDDSQTLQEITDYIENVNQLAITDEDGNQVAARTFLLNFSRNKTAHYVNSVVIGEYLYVKLYEPLDSTIDVGFKVWVVEEKKPSYIDNVSIITDTNIVDSTLTELAGPNWDAFSKLDTSTDTGLKTWNDLLGSSVSTSQQLVDSIFSGSLSGVDLNIDYEDFNNFIFYGSAVERVKNFHYKISLIEYYESQISILNSLSGSLANVTEYTDRKTKLVSGFDSFEKFLYYESSSGQFSNNVPLVDANVGFITGSYITPWPKSNATRTYTLYPITSSQVTTWYETLLNNASTYDRFNKNALVYAIPEFIRTQPGNEGLDTFINMLGQHYDILYTYINYMSKIHSRDEHPKYGVPNELLYSVAKQFGWSLTDGNQYKDLWEYVLGTNEAGTPITGSNSVGEPALPGKEMTYHVWRRIVNNLPLLLKSKGTKRSIKALLSCYGIPQSMISIQEYGGPRLERAPVYEKLNFDYALDLIQNTAGTVVTDYSQSIGAVELRFRTDTVLTNPSMPSTMNLFSVGSNDVTLDFTRGTLGTIQLNGTSSANFECFDGGWITALLRTSGSGLELVAKKSKYGKIVSTISASSDIASFPTQGSITLGGTSGAARLQGQLQELRIWESSLGNSALDNHTKAPSAYDGNVSAYDELIYRLPVTQKIDHSATSSLSGVQPVASTISSSFSSWTNATPYDSIEETYYFDGISLAAGTFDDNKIRIEENELIGTLDVKTRAERSQFDKAPLDSKKLGVYFSPQTMINDDIIAQLGFTELDSYIGDPGQTYEKSYPDLIRAARDYWKKYDTKNDLNAYIKIFTLFDLSFFNQLEQLLPARVDKITGVLIQPNLLERNKDSALPRPSRTLDSYNTDIDVQTTIIFDPTYDTYLGEVDGAIATITAQDDDQLQGYLTKSSAEKYDGTQYSRDYFFWSGSTYIPGTTPYWMSEGVMPYISSSTKSTERETLSYTEYRRYVYPITHPISSSSTVSYTNTGSVFESFKQQGSGTTYTTSSVSINLFQSSYSDNPRIPDDPYFLLKNNTQVPILEITSGSDTTTAFYPPSISAYIREVIPSSVITEETVTYYELINSGSGNPTGSSANIFWGDLYEYLVEYSANTEYPDNSRFFSMPVAIDISNRSVLNQVDITLTLGSGSVTQGSVASSFIPSGIVSSTANINTTGGNGTYYTTLTFTTELATLLTALGRTGEWANGAGVISKLQLDFYADTPFSSDTVSLQTTFHLGSTLPQSYILANISSSKTDSSTISGYVTSSGQLFPDLTWYSTGSFDPDLDGIDAYGIIPRGSLTTISFSSSLSASLAASPGNNLIQFTGMDIQIAKWGVTGSISGVPDVIVGTKPLTITDYVISVNGVNAIAYRSGSNLWSTSEVYPTGGARAAYGLTNALLVNGIVETNAATIDSIIRDWIYTQSTYTTMSIGIQPAISSSVYTTDTALAYARITGVGFYYTYSGSAITGSTPTGYIVVSGSDILTADIGVAINGPAEYQDFTGTGLQKSFYEGSKMTSRAFNVASLDTIDGGPVVETREANPNQLIYQSPGENGSFTISGG